MLNGCQNIYKGPILKLVYPWYINTEQNRRKDDINSITHTRTLKILYAGGENTRWGIYKDAAWILFWTNPRSSTL